MKGKNIIVTGGLGFIGSHLTETLVRENHVTLIDNESTGNLKNVSHLTDKGLEVVIGDVDELDLATLFAGHDYVFHEAALPSVPRSVKDPLGSNESSVTGTLKVLVAAKDSDVQKVVFASSSLVYGDPAALPKQEDMRVNPMSPYAVTKLTGEYYCSVFSQIYGLPTVSPRYFNVFGPRQDPTSHYAAVIPKFITAILTGSRPTVYGDGRQTRDFTFVKHVVQANLLACESDATGTFNIACGRSIRINELVALINEIMGTAIEPKYLAPRPGDVKHSLADITKAHSFGYRPSDNFKDELAETIRWFEDGLRQEH